MTSRHRGGCSRAVAAARLLLVIGRASALLAPARFSSSVAADIDGACAARDGEGPAAAGLRLSRAFRPLASFGSVSALPLTRAEPLGDAEMLAVTGLSPVAFAPSSIRKRAAEPPRQRRSEAFGIAGQEAKLPAAAIVMSAQFVLAGAALQADGPMTSLRSVAWWQLPAFCLCVMIGFTVLLAVADTVAMDGQLVAAAAQLLVPRRQEAVLRHEAGHFLMAHLLGCPVQACSVYPWQELLGGSSLLGGRAGTLFHARAISELNGGGEASEEEVDAACLVLMGGVAGEAMTLGVAEGGASDEADLRALLLAHWGRVGGRGGERAVEPESSRRRVATSGDGDDDDEAEIRARARWAAASALMVLRERRGAYDALCAALRAGSSVGECVEAIEASLPME